MVSRQRETERERERCESRPICPDTSRCSGGREVSKHREKEEEFCMDEEREDLREREGKWSDAKQCATCIASVYMKFGGQIQI